MSFEPQHDKISKMTCVPSGDSDQLRHPPGLIAVFTVRMNKPWVLNFPLRAQRSSDSDQTDRMDAQADLSLHWVHMPFCWFCHALAQL